jgi:hypothetical protein
MAAKRKPDAGNSAPRVVWQEFGEPNAAMQKAVPDLPPNQQSAIPAGADNPKG